MPLSQYLTKETAEVVGIDPQTWNFAHEFPVYKPGEVKKRAFYQGEISTQENPDPLYVIIVEESRIIEPNKSCEERFYLGVETTKKPFDKLTPRQRQIFHNKVLSIAKPKHQIEAKDIESKVKQYVAEMHH